MLIKKIVPTKPEEFEIAIKLLNEVFASFGQEEAYTSQRAFEKTKESKDKLILLALQLQIFTSKQKTLLKKMGTKV